MHLWHFRFNFNQQLGGFLKIFAGVQIPIIKSILFGILNKRDFFREIYCQLITQNLFDFQTYSDSKMLKSPRNKFCNLTNE